MTRKGNETGHELEQDPELTYNPGFSDSGNAPDRDPLLRPGTAQDLSQPAKVTLGNYLSALSRGQVNRGQANSFQLPGGSSDTQGAGMTVNPNMSNRISPNTAKSEMQSAGSTLGSFLDLTKGYGGGAAEKFDDTKNSEYAKSDNPFKDTDIKRIGSDERRKSLDGNSLLTNIKSTSNAKNVDLGNPDIGQVPEDAPVVQKKISDVLRQNRFNPIEKAFVQNHERQNSGYTIQRQVGKYDPSSTAALVDEEKLKQVGLQLMIRATGHGISGVDLLDLGNDQTAMNNLAPLVPTLAQFTGLPVIDTVNLRAGNVPVAQNITGGDSKRSEYVNPDGGDFNVFAGKTYGVLNSHLEPFDGPLPIGTLTTTVAGIIGIVGFSALVGALPMLLDVRKPGAGYTPSVPINLRKGRRGMVNDDMTAEFFLDLFGVPKTDHNWGECLFAGIGAFFGIGELSPGQGITAETILESAFNIAMAPGYYAVVIRNAIRDTEQVVKSIESFAEGISQTNVVLSVSNFFKMIEAITTSATYRFVMAMVRLGNQVLNYGSDFETGGGADVDSMQYNASNRHMKSRIVLSSNLQEIDLGSTSDNALAWKHSAAQSRYILPKSFIEAHSMFKQTDRSLASHEWKRLAYTPGMPGSTPKLPDGSDYSSNSPSSDLNRIPGEYVKQAEDRLEAEYMPFYFHDLRTNEIISFHAFLTDLSDGFTANYNSTSGYGRIEDVMIYNNTKRSISFTFYVAATSDQDHSVMYWNINKIVSMLYPQFSRGRTMVNGADKFIQPFSQIPTASPMIRLRIGDVVKSNYSKFGIARLFGLGQDASVFNMDMTRNETVSVTGAVPPDPDARAAVESDLAARRRDGIYISEDVVLLANNQNYSNRNSAGLTAREARDNTAAGRSSRRVSRYRNNIEVTVKSQILELPAAPSSATATRQETARSAARRRVTEPTYLVQVNNTTEGGFMGGDAAYSYHIVRASQILNFSPDYVDSLVSRRSAGSAGTTSTTTTAGVKDPASLSRFLSSDSNPIIKSFESARGRGLAGFITDLKMDWAESPWDIRPGSRAPMFMKLSVSFSPIHDIPMGLDSDGMMRSVAYNVGEFANSIGHDPYDGGTDKASFEKTSREGLGESIESGAAGDSLGSAAGV